MNRTSLAVLGLGLFVGALVNCSSSDSTGPGKKAGPTPTAIHVTWTLAGQPASADSCSAHQGVQVYVNLGGTVDTSMHQTTTLDCATGSAKFDKLTVEGLGTPFLDVILLDKDGKALDEQGVPVEPVANSTDVTVDFFAPMTTTSSTDATTGDTTAETTATSGSGGGMGGATGAGGMGTTSGAGGMGGAGTTSGAGGAGGA